jgi:hypothetical protein
LAFMTIVILSGMEAFHYGDSNPHRNPGLA